MKNSNIQSLILDVDGVIVGQKIGFNSPNPHPEIIVALKNINEKGIPISLCTAKPHFSIGKIIKDAQLDNVHITDGGGVIVNPLSNEIVKQNNVPTDVAIEVVDALLEQNVYTEVYTVDDYIIQKSQVGDITPKHAHVLQKEAVQVDALTDYVKDHKITKVMPIALNEQEKPKLEKIFEPFKDRLTLSWGVHPVILPLQFGIITAPGISKKQGALEISKSAGIPLENTLGVGDSASDWQFIEMCGYGAAMGNAKEELKDLVQSKPESRYSIGGSVDENGLVDIFRNFELI